MPNFESVPRREKQKKVNRLESSFESWMSNLLSSKVRKFSSPAMKACGSANSSDTDMDGNFIFE